MMLETQHREELCFPELLNSSCKKPMSRPKFLLLNSLLFSMSVVTLVLNLLVIVSISHFRQLHKPTNLLILSLAVSDFLVGIVVLPGEILRQTSCWFLGDLMCSLYKCFMFINTSASIGDMVLLSVDRYVAICDPLHYSSRVTVRRVNVCICLCWLCSGVYSALFLKDVFTQPGKFSLCRGECAVVFDSAAGAVDLVLTFVVPISIIVVLYMRVFVVALSQARAVRSHAAAAAAASLQSSVAPTKKSELKAARTLGLILLVYFICFCPYYGVSLSGGQLLNTLVGDFVLCLFCLNPTLNPIIYALFYPWFRKVVKLVVTLQILQPGSCEANIL